MSVAEPLRVGWCPGVLRPMLAGDGLLVRIKPRGGRIPVASCQAIAALSGRFGNGGLTVTGRANLQLRGVAEADLPPVTEALSDLGLLDLSDAGEAVRNVVSSPLAGFDPEARFDIRPAVAALEGALAGDPELHRLPAKFAWVVDDDGSLPLTGVTADVRFTAVQGRFTVRLGGDASDLGASCAPRHIHAVAVVLAKAFLDLCAEAGLVAHRMADLRGRVGAQRVLERAGLSAVPIAPPERGSPRCIGLFDRGAASWVGAAPPFGRLEATMLDRFADLAGQAGAADVALTPWRSLVAAGLGAQAAERLWTSLSAAGSDLGLIVDPADPRLNVAACTGAPACRRATVPVQADAARVARALPPRLEPGIAVHVSGCAKGCAHGQAAPVTLVGRDGLYDLVRDGKAGDPPAVRGLRPDALPAALASVHTPAPRPGPAEPLLRETVC